MPSRHTSSGGGAAAPSAFGSGRRSDSDSRDTQRQPSGKCGARGGGGLRAAEVDHVYVLMKALDGVVNVLHHNRVWRRDLARILDSKIRRGRRRRHFDRDPRFLQRLALHRLNGVLVRLDMPAGGKPRSYFGMPVERHASVSDDESGRGEVPPDVPAAAVSSFAFALKARAPSAFRAPPPRVPLRSAPPSPPAAWRGCARPAV